eukprot:365973-Chlamydomonas_euryale.AAC.20
MEPPDRQRPSRPWYTVRVAPWLWYAMRVAPWLWYAVRVAPWLWYAVRVAYSCGTPCAWPHGCGTPCAWPHGCGTPCAWPHGCGTPCAWPHGCGTPCAWPHGRTSGRVKFSEKRRDGGPALAPAPAPPASRRGRWRRGAVGDVDVGCEGGEWWRAEVGVRM